MFLSVKSVSLTSRPLFSTPGKSLSVEEHAWILFSVVSLPFPSPLVLISFGNFNISPFASHGTSKQVPLEEDFRCKIRKIETVDDARVKRKKPFNNNKKMCRGGTYHKLSRCSKQFLCVFTIGLFASNMENQSKQHAQPRQNQSQ